jgi:predicted transcriptional regulator
MKEITEKLNVYSTSLNYILINAKFQIFFDVKGKGYLITKEGDEIWLENVDDSIRCKLLDFVMDSKTITVVTDEECKLNGWLRIQK